MRRELTLLLPLLSLPWVSAPSAAQQATAPTADLLSGLEFRSIGPATMGGRVDDLAFFAPRPTVFYVGAATGGVWKTTNAGTTWEPVFDGEASASIGALAVAQDDPDLVWVGTGEDNNRQSSSWGAGVFKSTDGGATWTLMGLEETRHIGRVVIDPDDHDVVYVAADGHLWGSNPERGVFKTTDGGAIWTRVLFVDEDTGASDLAMDPSNSRVLYAAMYQRRRTPWGFNGGGPGSGLYKSGDGGGSWIRLTEGLPESPLGRIAVDIHRADPRIVYALVEAAAGTGLYRSDDGGDHWEKVSDTNPRPSYFSQVRVDPEDADRVYVVGVRLMISDDGGKTFEQVRVAPAGPGGGRPRDDLDVHALWIDPANPSHLVLGCDVGVAISWDRGASWDYANNLPIGQFYHVGYDMDTPYRVYGGLQDNDVWGGPSASRNLFGIGNRDWFSLAIGDGFVATADPGDSGLVYGETQNGRLSLVNRETGEQRSLRPQVDPGDPPLRWAWDAPFLLSPHDPGTLLLAAQRVFRSTDRGQSWEAISPDLTGGADRDTLTIMGVPGGDITLSRNDGVSAWPTLTALAESPVRAGLYYAGSDDGRVHVSRDGGESWTDVSDRFPGLPAGAVVEELAPSAFDEATAYATFDNHGADDYRPWVFTTADYGESWASLAASLPAGEVVNCITEDPRNGDVLYLGTESGLFVTLDRGQAWVRLRNNLPTVPIDEITIHPRDNDLLLATHGRSLWILDDLSPIQEAAEAAGGPAHLFSIDPAAQLLLKNDFAGYPGDRVFWGQNPAPGAAVLYWLGADTEEVGISVLDGSGAVVRTWSAQELEGAGDAGLNRVTWDLRHQPLAVAAGGGRSGGGGRGGRPSPGPYVLPGDYRVELEVGGQVVGTRTVRVSPDPLIRAQGEDLQRLHAAAFLLHRLQDAMVRAATAVDTATAQVDTARGHMEQLSPPPAVLTEAVERMAATLAELAPPLATATRSPFGGGGGGSGAPGGAPTLRDRVTTLKSALMSWMEAPSAAQLRETEDARFELEALLDRLNAVLTEDLPELYAGLEAAGLSPPPRSPIFPVEIR